MQITQKIDSISSKKDLKNFIKSVDYKISFWKGRKFYYKGAQGELSFQQLVSKLYHKCQENPKFASPIVLGKLNKLNRNAEESLKKQSCWVRWMTALKRRFSALSWEKDLKLLGQLRVRESPPTSEEDQEVEEATATATNDDQQLQATFDFFDRYGASKQKSDAISSTNKPGKKYKNFFNNTDPEWKNAKEQSHIVLKHLEGVCRERLQRDLQINPKKFFCRANNAFDRLLFQVIVPREGRVKCTGFFTEYFPLRAESVTKEQFPDDDFLQFDLPWPKNDGSVNERTDRVYKQLKEAVEGWKEVKKRVEKACFDDNVCKVVPSKSMADAQLELEQTSVTLNDQELQVSFHIKLCGRLAPDEKDTPYFANKEFDRKRREIELDAGSFESNVNKLLKSPSFETQFANECLKGLSAQFDERVKKWKQHVENPFPDFTNFFGSIDDQPSDAQAASSAEVEKLDKWMGLEGKLKVAYESKNKEEGEKLLANTVIRKASLKIHPDHASRQGITEQEATEKFNEFTKLVAGAKAYFKKL